MSRAGLGGRAGPIGALALALLLALAAPVAAAPRRASRNFTLPGSQAALVPDLAVGEDGTAHFVWNEGESGNERVRYCRIPRGGRHCSPLLTLEVPQIDIPDYDGPKVLVAPDGRVLVFKLRGEELFEFTSTDGGASFSPPTLISDESPGLYVEPRLGPGAYSVSTVSSTAFQAAPLAGSLASGVADLGEGRLVGEGGGGGNGSIGFADSLTPVVAMEDVSSGHAFFRRFAGGADYNDLASWSPLIDLGPGRWPLLASLLSGRRGLHMMLLRGNGSQRRYVALTYDGTTFSHQVTVSGKRVPGYPASFFMDGGGRLHALWLDQDQKLIQRVSVDGSAWKPPETLADTLDEPSGGSIYYVRAAAARDGGGFAVYEYSGPLRVVPFGPAGKPGHGGKGGGGPCVDSLRVGGATVVAQQGCLRRGNGGRYTTGGDIRVNGIDLRVGGAKVTIDRGKRTLTTSGPVAAGVGKVKLGKQRLDWRLPAGKGEVTDLAGNPASFNTSKLGVEVLGLPVSGYTVPRLTGAEGVGIEVNLSLPAPLGALLGGSATGAATLRASNEGGLDLTGLHVHAGDLALGIAEIRDLDLRYVRDPFLLQGGAAIVLPVAGTKLDAEFGLRQGGFDYGRGSLTFTNPLQLAVATDVLLKRIDFAVQRGASCAKPTQIGGGVRLLSAPEIAGASLIAVDGDVAYAFPKASCGEPGVLSVHGAGKFIGFPVTSLTARLTTEGQFTFHTGVGLDLGVASASVDVGGGVDIPSKSFFASGKASVALVGYSIAGADAILSNVGISACGGITAFGVEVARMGFHHRWSDSFSGSDIDWPPSCSLEEGAFKPAAFARPALSLARPLSWASASAAGAAGTASFKLPAGLPFATVRVSGAGAAPGVAISGPGGLSVSYPDPAQGLVATRQFAAAAHDLQTEVRLVRPVAGTYTVAAAPGSTIGAVAVADGLPTPTAGGRVRTPRHHRGLRVLSYRGRGIKGQRLVFVEEGAHGVRDVLGARTAARGRLRFRPTGPHGKRTIYALVEREGIPRAKVAVAHYVAPGPRRPGRPRRLALRRRGSRLLVSWHRVPGAARYAVAWRLRDGRRQATTTKRPHIAIRGVPGIDAGRIRVAGVSAANLVGRAAGAKLRAHPKRLRRHRRR